MSKEAKVGFLGILGLVLFFIAVPSSSTRDSKLLGNTYHLIMSEGDRINEGDPVKLAGISVGTIDKINFTTPEQRQTYGDDANIIVTVNADAGVRIPVDSVVDVNTAQKGNFWLDIQPGTSSENLVNGRVVRLASGVSSHGAKLQDGTKAIRSITEMTQEYRDTLSDPKLKATIQDLASNARFYTNEVKLATSDLAAQKRKIYEHLDEAQTSAMQQIDRINVQIDLGAERLKKLRPQLHEKTAVYNKRLQASQKQISGMLATAQRETQKFKQISDKAGTSVQKLAEDPQYRAKLRKAAHKLENLAQTAEDIKSITSEPSVREGLQGLVHQYREQSEAIKKKVEAWEKILPDSDSAPKPAPESTPHAVPAPEPQTSPAPALTSQTPELQTSATAQTASTSEPLAPPAPQE